MEKEVLRRKFDKKAYLETLHNLQREFSKEYRIYLAESFDPRNWLKSKDVEAKLIWPRSVREEYKNFKRGECKSLDFWFSVYSKRKEEIYIFAIKYTPYQFSSSTIFFPSIYAHECPYTISWITSFGSLPIACKHVYAVLREVDEIIKKEENEEKEKKEKIPIPESLFYPRSPEVWDIFESIEKDRKLSPEEKLKETFKLLEEGLYINELPKLRTLNRRLKFLRKV